MKHLVKTACILLPILLILLAVCVQVLPRELLRTVDCGANSENGGWTLFTFPLLTLLYRFLRSIASIFH